VRVPPTAGWISQSIRVAMRFLGILVLGDLAVAREM
jgi:hypothetical protein